MRAVLRKLRTDFRTNRVQRIFIVLLLAFATAALTASLTVQARGGTAWEQLFRESNGAHAWFYGDAATLEQISAREGVSAIAGPYAMRQARIPAIPSPEPRGFPLLLQGLDDEVPLVARPIVTSGRWAQSDDEVVLPRMFAREFGYRVGGTISIESSAGARDLRVVGLAVFAGRSPFSFPQIAWTNNTTLEAVGGPPSSALGIQLESRGLIGSFIAALERDSLAEGVLIEDWRMVREDNNEATRVISIFLGVFSVFALISAGFVIINAISGRVLARYRDIGLMKALGFTPRQITGGLLIEQLGLAAIGVAGGAFLGTWMATALDDPASKEFATGSRSAFRPGLLLAIGLGVLAIVGVATLLPAWRAGRIPAVQAITAGPSHLSYRVSGPALAGRALRLPLWMVAGLKDAFDRPARSWITVAALMLSVVTVTFVATTEWTLRQLIERPELTGEPFEVAVESDDPARLEDAISSDPAAETYVERVTLPVSVPGKDEEARLAVLGPGYEKIDWVVTRGRLFSAPGEMTVGKGFLDLTGASIGESVQLLVSGKPVQMRIVGMYRATEDSGRWAMTSTETARQFNIEYEKGGFAVALKDGENADAAAQRYRTAGAQGSEVFNHSVEGINEIRTVLGGLGAMLLLVGLVSLVNTISVGIRERRRDLGVLKAIGFTPRQIVGSVLSSAFVLAAIAISIGVPIGLWVSMRISDEIGNRLGWGPGLFEAPPAAWVIAVVPFFLSTVALAALVPGMFAARLRASEALRTE